jgi:hypothetical protein
MKSSRKREQAVVARWDQKKINSFNCAIVLKRANKSFSCLKMMRNNATEDLFSSTTERLVQSHQNKGANRR